jgi:prefoldin subunit 4
MLSVQLMRVSETQLSKILLNNLRLNIGESFIVVEEDEAKEYVAKQQKKYNDQKDEFISKYESNKKRLDELKIILYTKFGKSIHLEED